MVKTINTWFTSSCSASVLRQILLYILEGQPALCKVISYACVTTVLQLTQGVGAVCARIFLGPNHKLTHQERVWYLILYMDTQTI